MSLTTGKPAGLPNTTDALLGRAAPVPTAESHFISGRPLQVSIPETCESIVFGMGCFWGAERLFWDLQGVWITSVGYAGGITPNPTYEETCTGMTGHTEAVQIHFDPAAIAIETLLKTFWENHDPTQGMRQGNDKGSQYRSAVFTANAEQAKTVIASKDAYASQLAKAGRGAITTEITPLVEYYFAEEHHQQYLAKNPSGYCGIGGTGVTCPIGGIT